ncbi:PD40 domain-containing protein [Telmatocola sphagniphila]|uniref:Tricorn protease homolog n=1 Tax=Telmatocola sphagniphila TaxID=1123043 RepID=A0A8E6EWN4_9BACT|nr:S41 family peptidase [Telmatocola sphagniphila]QVL33967.1 PD40 domain-containing protein [Telmatocola sphagniphila]
MLQRPTVSEKLIAFSYAGDLWTVDRSGGDARRLTAGVGLETYPVFSPDGKMVAFAGDYEGNLDVYVIPSEGGIPKRLTYHPDSDAPVGWTPDGKNILFRSGRTSSARFLKLFSVPVEGGQPSELPLPMAEDGSLSPDGKKIAYVPLSNKPPFPGSFRPVRNYRGGTASPVWIADLADSSITKVPRKDSNDFNPMWIGDQIYFLSDRDGPTTLFAYNIASKEVKRVLAPEAQDIKSASSCGNAIVYDRFGSVHLFDVTTGVTKPVSIRINADLPGVRPKLEKVAKNIQKASLSPTGVRALFEARGEVVSVPVEKGDVRNLTNSTGVAERDPVWSPDGKAVAYLSDESGEYKLHIRSQSGFGEVKKFTLGESPSFYYNPVWSPDSKRIAYQDKRQNLFYIDLETGKSTKADTGPYDDDVPSAPVWSPDGRWLAHSRLLKNYLYAVFLHSLETGKTSQITDGMSDAKHVAFDKSGKYLFLTASTDIGPAVGSGMSSLNRPVTRSAYVIVLNKTDHSPLAPESDDEKVKQEKEKKENDKEKKEGSKELPKVTIDLDDIDQRTLSLPVPAKNYIGLLSCKAGSILLLEAPVVLNPDDSSLNPDSPPLIVHRFDLEKKKMEKLIEGTTRVAVSFDGEKMLYRLGDNWFVTGTGQPAKPGEGELKLDKVEILVDPRAEWRQIYREVLRLERDFLYDPHFHGYDLKGMWAKHEPYLNGLGSRYELNYLLDELLAGLSLQHVYLTGGDVPRPENRKCGLLGADYRVENDRHRIIKVYRGESWNPSLRAPLTQPGAQVKEGEYLLAVEGRELRGEDEIYRLFEGTAGRQVVLKVGPSPDGKESREITVVPTSSERALRNLAWVDANRRTVDRLTEGRVAYIYLPDTQSQGYTRFNRYFFAQAGREGAIVDERFNGGGLLADHVIDYLRQPIRNYASTREGADQAFPTSAIPGPKVMLINEQAGSGGDYLPYTFRQSKLGPLVGKRTWGGLVGIGGYPELIDGGSVTAPRWGIWFPNSRWDVENRGVAPDIEVEFDPRIARQGKDPQLEKAIEIVLEELKKSPVKRPNRPPFPNYYEPGLKERSEGK